MSRSGPTADPAPFPPRPIRSRFDRHRLSARRQLSRIPFGMPHIVDLRLGATRCGAEHGGTSSCRVDGGTIAGVTRVGAVGAAGRSGPGSCDRAVAQRLDERADCSGLWGDAGQRAALAQLVRGSWDRGPSGDRASRSRGGEERGGGERRGVVVDGAGGRSGELDVAPAASRDRATGRGLDLEVAAQQDAKKNGYRWRRPRHCLLGRQEPDAVDRAGLRLKLLKQQADAGDIVLLSQDESEVLTHPYLAHAWAKRG